MKFNLKQQLGKILLGVMLCLGSPMVHSLDYPLLPTQFADLGIPLVATDENGHAMAAYTNQNTGQINTYYFSDNVWNFMPLGDGSDIALAMNASGLAILTYVDSSGNLGSYYFDGTMWNTPLTNPIDTAISDNGSVSITDIGLGVASWTDSAQNIRIAFFTGFDWTAPSPPLDIGIGSRAQVALSETGALVIAWEDLLGNVSIKHFISGVWSPVTVFANAELDSVGISDNGKSLVLVRGFPTFDLYANYFINGTLDSSTVINPPQPFGPAIFGPSLDMAANGTAVAVWKYDQTFFNQYDLYYAQFDGNTWAPAVNVQTGIPVSDPAVSVDSSGNALIFWANYFGDGNPVEPSPMYVAQLPVGGVLTVPQLVYTSPFSRPVGLAVSLADNGFNALVWAGTDQFEAFVPFGLALVTVTPPVGANGQACFNRFAMQTERYNIITWEPSTDDTVVSYRLERDGILIASISAVSPLIYVDHNRCGQIYVYTLTAINGDGIASDPVIITINSRTN